MSKLENFIKIEMVKDLTPEQFVDAMDKFEKENNKLKAGHKELAEAAENMLELLVNNAPIDGLYSSRIDEWDCLIKEVLK